MNYTYLLLHPSSSRFVEKILEEILYNGFQIFGIYRVDEWYKVTEEIYKNSYIKSRTVRQHVIAQAFIISININICWLGGLKNDNRYI